MAYEFKFVRTVEFSETDMAGIVHFSNYSKYMEAAEPRFFRSIGHSIVPAQIAPPVGCHPDPPADRLAARPR